MSTPHVAVLGGGFAGLSAATHLALAGIQVTLFEQQPQLGGKAGEIAHGGYRFDTGPSVWTLPHILQEIFAQAGEPPPVFAPLSPLCRYNFASGRVWDVYQDAKKTTLQLSAAEAETYLALLNRAKKLYQGAAPTFVLGQKPALPKLLRYALSHGFDAPPWQHLQQLLRAHGASGDLESFFLRFATYFGANPYRAPAILHNIAYAELGLGAYYPVDGIHGVVTRLAALAQKLGVRVHTGVRVTRLLHQQGRVRSVQTARGNYPVSGVISSLDVIRSHELLGRRAPQATLSPSLSGFVLLLGIEGQTPKLKHHNIFFAADYRAEFAALERGEFAADPTLYVSLSCRTRTQDAPEGCENWFVLVNAPALADGRPANLQQARRYAAHLVERLEHQQLGVRSRIRFQKFLSPTYFAKLATRGAIYGHAPHSLLGALRPSPQVRGVENLFLAGGTVHPGGGVPLVLLSGKYAAERLLKAI